MRPQITTQTIIEEGLADCRERQEARAAIARAATAAGLTVQDFLRQRAEKARLRRRATDLGLAFWPALYHGGVDPQAFAIAEQVMANREGSRWGDILSDIPDELAREEADGRLTIYVPLPSGGAVAMAIEPNHWAWAGPRNH